MPGILVGVDGSDQSHRALTWALHEAAHHRVPLMVMAVQPSMIRPATHTYWNLPTLPENSSDLEHARTELQNFVDKLATDTGDTPPEITVSVVNGDPAEHLINASRDADLLVVGSRGSGAFTKLLIGSVSSKVTHHAASPVVVVP
jgi:nucleotide-binding universal stress UspA family protein